MKSQRILIGAFALGLLLVLAVGLSLAQEPEPGEIMQSRGEVSIAGTVSSKISYQGVLKEGGAPVNGTRAITFTLYSDDACSAEVYTIAKNAVSVTGGLFSVDLPVNHSDFNGQPLWLEAEVGGTRVGCQEILPVPYALSLRPGAIISGTAYQAFRVNSYAPTGSSPAAIVGIVNEAEDGVGVFAKNYTSSAGATGTGVWGATDSPAGKGIYGQATSSSGLNYGVYGSSSSPDGYGIWGTNSSGVGVYGNGDTGVYGNSPAGTGVAAHSITGDPIRAYGGTPPSEVLCVDNTGTVTQTLEATGLVKAGAYVFCSSSDSLVDRSFNNVNDVEITISNGSSAGQCSINFGFSINERYWVTSPGWTAGSVCCYDDGGSTLICYRQAGDGTAHSGMIMVLIY
jgi:hypothetical protein